MKLFCWETVQRKLIRNSNIQIRILEMPIVTRKKREVATASTVPDMVSAQGGKTNKRIRKRVVATKKASPKTTGKRKSQSAKTKKSLEPEVTESDASYEETSEEDLDVTDDSTRYAIAELNREEELEREVRRLKLEVELEKLRRGGSDRETRYQPTWKSLPTGGNNNLGVFNGLTDLETFLFRFQNCVKYYKWNQDDQLFQLKNSLVDSAGYIITEIGNDATTQEIIDLLRLRFGNENQQERFRTEMKSRKRQPGETLQQLYRDLCRLKSLAFGQEVESSFSKLFMRDVFLDAINNRELRKQILIQKPSTMEEALKMATHIEAIDALETPRSAVRDSQRVRHKVQNLDSGAGPNRDTDTSIQRQLAEMRNALQDVRQELALTRQQQQNDKPSSGQFSTTKNLSVPVTDEDTVVEPRAAPGEPRNRSESTFARRGTCRVCRKVGHWAAECPVRKDREANRFFRNAAEGRTEVFPRDTNPNRVFGKNHDSKEKTEMSTIQLCDEAHVRIRFDGKSVCALLDTGCGQSVVGRTVVSSYQLEPTTRQLFTANGEPLPIAGQMVMNFQIGGIWSSVKVLVSEAIHELILGIDWLIENRCVWNFGQTYLDFKGKRIHTNEAYNVKFVRKLLVSKDTVVEAKKLTHVPVMAMMHSVRNQELWAVQSRVVQRDLIVGSSICKGEDLYTAAQVINLSDNPRTLRKGEMIGEAEIVQLVEPTPEEEVSVQPEDLSTRGTINVLGDKSLNQVTTMEGTAKDELDYLKPLHDNMGGTLSADQRSEVIQFLEKNKDVFSRSEYDLGRTDLVKHVIDTGHNKPFKQQLRRHPIGHLEIIDKHVEEMLANDIIEPSSSPWASNVVLVKKQDGSLRFCVDFRQLNLSTIKDSYPLPRIDTCFDALGGVKYLSTLDLRSGYWQVVNDPSTADKTSFVTRKGSFKFKVLAFGLSNAPAVFQRLMDLVLVGLTWEICLVFLDDIIVMSTSFEQHLERLSKVFDRLRTAGLKLKPSKCHLFQTRVKFLGSVVSESGIEPDPDKVKTVAEWPIPTTLTELRSFVALASYYRRHIQNFAEIARPLHNLTKKGCPFQWGIDQQRAFEELKHKLVNYPVLANPLPEGEYVVDTDASDEALGAVLQQRQGGVIRVLAYASRVMDPSERFYCTTRKELLGIIFALKQFRHYLLSSPFLLRTDHAALTSLMRSPEPVGQQARWLDLLAEYSFRIEHRAGRLHSNSDSLSRRPCGSRKCTRDDCLISACDGLEDGPDNGVPAQFPPRLGRMATRRNPDPEEGSPPENTSTPEMPIGEHTLSLDIVRQAQENDPVLCQVRVLLEEPEWRTQVDEFGMGVVHLWNQRNSLVVIRNILHRQFERVDGSILYDQVLVPLKLREQFLYWVHEDPSSGHFGVTKTQEKLQCYAYWPGWRKDVESYVRRCDICNRYKKGPSHRQGPLQSAVGLSAMQKVHIDLTGPHPRSNQGHVYLLTAICAFTKYLITVPLKDKTALSVARALVKHVFLIHGAVELLVHDNGKEFINDIMFHVSRLLGIQNLRTTFYRPSANSSAERVHRTINAIIAKTVSQNLKNWCEISNFVTFAYNCSRHSSTTFSPFYLMFWREPRVGIDLLLETQEPAYSDYDEYSDDVRRKMQIANGIVEQQLRTVFERAKRRYDQRVKAVQFKVGEFVYYYSPRLHGGRGRKFRNLTSGPFKIMRKVNHVNYVIQKTPHARPFTVHVDRLLKYWKEEVPPCWKNEALKTTTEIASDGSGLAAGSKKLVENVNCCILIKSVDRRRDDRKNRSGLIMAAGHEEIAQFQEEDSRVQVNSGSMSELKIIKNSEKNIFNASRLGSRDSRKSAPGRGKHSFHVRCRKIKLCGTRSSHKSICDNRRVQMASLNVKTEFNCKLCGKQYKWYPGLWKHMAKVHHASCCTDGTVLPLEDEELEHRLAVIQVAQRSGRDSKPRVPDSNVVVRTDIWEDKKLLQVSQYDFPSLLSPIHLPERSGPTVGISIPMVADVDAASTLEETLPETVGIPLESGLTPIRTCHCCQCSGYILEDISPAVPDATPEVKFSTLAKSPPQVQRMKEELISVTPLDNSEEDPVDFCPYRAERSKSPESQAVDTGRICKYSDLCVMNELGINKTVKKLFDKAGVVPTASQARVKRDLVMGCCLGRRALTDKLFDVMQKVDRNDHFRFQQEIEQVLAPFMDDRPGLAKRNSSTLSKANREKIRLPLDDVEWNADEVEGVCLD